MLVLVLGSAGTLSAQVIPDSLRTDSLRVDSLRADSLRADSLRVDSLAGGLTGEARRLDSLRADSIRRRAERDTIQPPMPYFRPPPSTELFGTLRWTRDEMLEAGAVNVADLLDAVPGVTTFRTSWLPGAHAASYLGDFRRVRVFLDGLELDSPDPEANGVFDLTDIAIAALDEVAVERTAGEVRVWLRSWGVTSTTAYTRTDIVTGDLNTNGFRGLLGRRWSNGMLLQLTASQAETQRAAGFVGGFGAPSDGTTGDGDVQHLTARVGWARGRLSVDGYLANARKTRDINEGIDEAFDLPELNASRRDAYVRAGYGDTLRGPWVQALLGSLQTSRRERSTGLNDGFSPFPPTDPGAEEDTIVRPDSSRSRTQRVFATGYAWEHLRVGAFARWRTMDGVSEIAPGAHVSLDRRWLTASLYADRAAQDSVQRWDLNTRAYLRPWLAVSFAHSSQNPANETARAGNMTTRAEGAVRLFGRWIGGGVIRQAWDGDERAIRVPQLLTPFDSGAALPTFPAVTSTGVTFGTASRVYKDLRMEVHGTQWNDGQEFRPGSQLRAALIFQTRWLSRFPRGQFGLNARFMYEARGPVAFVVPNADGSIDTRQTEDMNLGIVMLEIRIQRAVISYQFRNVFGGPYAQVPGIPMPPPHQFYGVRWEWRD